jgi:glycosyltransferase involved in cell wall biosynthesis
MEYMALGKPVIATSGGGTNEIVSETETGILIDDGNKQALNKAINTLLNSNDMRQRMGMHGKEIIRKKFNLSDMTREYLNIYTNSLAK